MKELKIRMHPSISKNIIEVAKFHKIDNDQLKALILSEIKSHLIAIMNPGEKSNSELLKLNEDFSQVCHSPNNSDERINWVNEYGVFYRILIPEELFHPKAQFQDFEIE